MGHTVEYVLAEYNNLKTQFPMPGCITVLDEQPGDFGIAHAWWNQYSECPAYVSFDTGYNPSLKTVRHELAHLMTWALEYPAYTDASSLMQKFWVARGFPGTADQAQAKAGYYVTNGDLWRGWQHYPLEAFAECFTAVLDPNGYEMTETYGVPLDKTGMLAWFKALSPEEEMTKEEREAEFIEFTQKYITPTIVAMKEEIFKAVEQMRRAGEELKNV